MAAAAKAGGGSSTRPVFEAGRSTTKVSRAVNQIELSAKVIEVGAVCELSVSARSGASSGSLSGAARRKPAFPSVHPRMPETAIVTRAVAALRIANICDGNQALRGEFLNEANYMATGRMKLIGEGLEEGQA
jgi:hypothetical protein